MREVHHEPNEEIPISYILNPEEISDSLKNVPLIQFKYHERCIQWINRDIKFHRKAYKQLKDLKQKRKIKLFIKYLI